MMHGSRPGIAAGMFLLAVLAGCSSAGGTASPLVPNQKIQLTASNSVLLGDLVTGGLVAAAVYVVFDPLAPNWDLKEARLNEDTFRLAMTMKRYHTGGGGESLQVVKRRATQLQMELGYGNYQLLEYTEGIESQTLGARRVVHATFRLLQPRQADSFQLNEAR